MFQRRNSNTPVRLTRLFTIQTRSVTPCSQPCRCLRLVSIYHKCMQWWLMLTGSPFWRWPCRGCILTVWRCQWLYMQFLFSCETWLSYVFLSTSRNGYIKPGCYQILEASFSIQMEYRRIYSYGLIKHHYGNGINSLHSGILVSLPDHVYPGSQAQSIGACLEWLLPTTTWPAWYLIDCSTCIRGHHTSFGASSAPDVLNIDINSNAKMPRG